MAENQFNLGDVVVQKTKDIPKNSNHYPPSMTITELSQYGTNNQVVRVKCQWFNPLTCTFSTASFHVKELEKI